MTTTLTRFKITALSFALLIFPLVAASQENPHWSKEGCQVCHQGGAPTRDSLSLTHTDVTTLCESCHGGGGKAVQCRHRSDLPAANVTVDSGLEGFLEDGRLTCSTCHDVVYQCERPRIAYRFQNLGFLRDRTSRNTADFCSKCHAPTKLEKLSPHGGVAGSPARPTCELCHASVPESNNVGELDVAFNMERDLNDACRGCHNVVAHPSGLFSRGPSDDWFHLVVPSVAVSATMKKTATETGVHLPLNPMTGEIFCGTCHDPHGFDSGSTQPKHRLRVIPICQACHEK